MRTRVRKNVMSPVVQIIVIAVIVGFVALVYFVSYAIHHRNRVVAVVSTAPPAPPGFFRVDDDQWRSLEFARVGSMDFADVTSADGTIAPPDDTTTQVLSPFTGRVTAVYVTVGDRVHKGQPLFAGTGIEYPQALNDLAQAQQTLYGAEVALKVIDADHRRLEKLLLVDGAARKDVEQRRSDLATARVNVRNAQIALALVRSRLGILGQSDRVDAARLALSHPRVLPSEVVVRAPADGTVVARAVGPGTVVQSGQDGASAPLLTLTDLSRVFFVANATEDDIAHVHTGDPIEVRMSAFPDRVFHARVRFISPTVDPTLHRIAVRAEVDNPDGALRPGMYGTFEIFIGPATDAVAVPAYAVIYEGDTAHVWIAGPNHTLAIRFVRADKTLHGMVEILGGLRSGDRVVTSGSVFIDRALRGDE